MRQNLIRYSGLFIICLSALLTLFNQGFASTELVDGCIMVKFDEGLLPIKVEKSGDTVLTGIDWLDSISVSHNLLSMHEMFVRPISEALSAWYILTFSGKYSGDYLDSLFESKAEVITAEPDYYIVLESPNDPGFGNQWYIDAIDVNTTTVWDDGNGVVGGPSVLIAVIDEGWNYMHPDFDEQVNDAGGIFFRNPGEEQLNYSGNFHAGDQLLGDDEDSDGNGFRDDYIGWDFCIGCNSLADTMDNNVWPDSLPANNYWTSHGTIVTGLIAAQTNNNEGVAGITGGWGNTSGCKILPCRTRRVSSVGPAINYAVNMAADNGIENLVLNLSLSFLPSDGMPQSVEQAVDSAIAHSTVKCVFVAAAGNSASNMDSTHFPGDHPEFINVAAIDSNYEKAFPSNYGPTVDIAAPSGNIYTTVHVDSWYTNDYWWLNFASTSYSAPIVTGVVALIWSAHPNLTRDEVREWLESSARDLSATEPDYADSLGAGLVNAADAVTGTINWFGEKTINDYFYVGEGRTLNVWPGTVVRLDENVEVVIDGGAKMIVEGTEEDPVIFMAKDWGEKWSEIFINGGALDMNHARIYDSRDACIYTNSPYEQGNSTPVRIRNTYMHGGDLTANAPALRLWGSPSYTQQVTSCVIDSVPSGVGMYLYNCYVDFDADTVRKCNVVNSYIKKVSGSFRDCVFKDRTSNYGVLFNSATCNPNITCSKFFNLAPPSGSFTTTVFAATGCSPTFAGTTAEYGRSNVIEDTSAYLLIVQGTGVKPTIVMNDWSQRSATGKFMEWRNYPGTPVAYDVDDQYWSSTPTTAMFTPSNVAYWDWTPYQGSAYGLCGGDGGGGGSVVAPGGEIARGEGSLDDPSFEELLLQAIDLESNEDFEEARSTYQDLVFAASSSAIRWRAMLGCVTTDVRCATPASWITTYIDSLRAVEGSSYEANVLRGRLHYSYLLNNAQYLDAIAECASLLGSGLQFIDSINVAIDLLGIQMAAGLIDDDGTLDDIALTGIPLSLQVESFEDGLHKESRLVELLGGGTLSERNEPLPTSFALHQNYPNPFNPSTEFSFDLPEGSIVELKVFDILGREVATVADKYFEAGTHHINWDSRSTGTALASGVYIYQIKAGGFTDAKKMILLR